MAGGPHAAALLCIDCLGKANRIAEGIEDDLYRCEQCGKKFGIDWSRQRPAKPCWPPTEAELAGARQLRELIQRSRQKPQGPPNP